MMLITTCETIWTLPIYSELVRTKARTLDFVLTVPQANFLFTMGHSVL